MRADVCTTLCSVVAVTVRVKNPSTTVVTGLTTRELGSERKNRIGALIDPTITLICLESTFIDDTKETFSREFLISQSKRYGGDIFVIAIFSAETGIRNTACEDPPLTITDTSVKFTRLPGGTDTTTTWHSLDSTLKPTSDVGFSQMLLKTMEMLNEGKCMKDTAVGDGPNMTSLTAWETNDCDHKWSGVNRITFKVEELMM